MLSDYSSMYLFTDEALKYLSSITSICDFQSLGLGENPRKGNEYYHSCLIYFCSLSNSTSLSIILPPTNNPRLWKTLPLWMWFWSPRLSPPAFFNTIFPNRHPIPSIWSRNCTASPTPLGRPTFIPLLNIRLSHPCFTHTYCRPYLWMTPRRPWMSRIDY